MSSRAEVVPFAMTHPLVLKLSRRDALPAREVEAITGLPAELRRVGRGETLVREGETTSHSVLLLSGWTLRCKTLGDGRASITAINITGDFVDLHAFLLKPMDHTVVTLTPCEIARVPHAALKRLTESEPHLARMLWLSTLIDAAIHRQWLSALGRLPAPSRLAHLFCELFMRLQAVEEVDGRIFPMPLTQGQLADALGLSTVHVNRSVRDLRERGLAAMKGGAVEVLDWEGLVALAEFDPAYLNLEPTPR